MPDDLVDRAVFAELQATAGADFIVELVDTFLAEAPGLLANLRDAYAGAESERFRRAAHSLKSNASTFGATRLAALARELEHSGLAGGQQKTAAALTALEADYAKVAAKLTTLKDLPHG